MSISEYLGLRLKSIKACLESYENKYLPLYEYLPDIKNVSYKNMSETDFNISKIFSSYKIAQSLLPEPEIKSIKDEINLKIRKVTKFNFIQQNIFTYGRCISNECVEINLDQHNVRAYLSVIIIDGKYGFNVCYHVPNMFPSKYTYSRTSLRFNHNLEKDIYELLKEVINEIIILELKSL